MALVYYSEYVFFLLEFLLYSWQDFKLTNYLTQWVISSSLHNSVYFNFFPPFLKQKRMTICFAHLEQAVSWELEPVLILHLSSVAGNRVCHDPLSSTGWCQQSSQWHSFPLLPSEASLLPAQSSLQMELQALSSAQHSIGWMLFMDFTARDAVAHTSVGLWSRSQGFGQPGWWQLLEGWGYAGWQWPFGGRSVVHTSLPRTQLLPVPAFSVPSHGSTSLAQVISVGLGQEMHPTLCSLRVLSLAGL